MKHVLAVAFAVGALAAGLMWPASSLAYDTFYDASCAQCHGPTRTCSGCHAHGAHNLANKQDFGVTATTNKASYAAGEEVVVSVGGGYRCGWVRMQLLDDAMKELAKSSGAGGLGNGPDSCNGTIPTPIVLRAPAPTTPGTYTWYAAWYGNKYDMFERTGAPTVFGPNFKDGPGAGHGRELVPVRFQVVGGGTPVVALASPSLVFPSLAVGATSQVAATVQNTGTATLQVSAITRCDANALPFSWNMRTPFSIGPGASVSLPVTFQPTAAVTSTTCLNLSTNDPASPTKRIDLSGAATPAPNGTPAVGTSVFSLSFGTSVLVGTNATRTFNVQSIGTANLTVTSVDPCPGSTMFIASSDTLPGVVAPGESRTVTVAYTPTAAGTNNGCVQVSTNGGVTTVNVSGGAIMPAVTCTSCHGGKDNATGAPPTDTAGETATTRTSVGAHSAHLNTQMSPTVAEQAADCTACHQTVVSFTDPKHRDGSTDVPFGGVSKAGGVAGAWDPKTPSCGTVYCHGATLADGTNTAPTWTNVGAGEAACGRCHGVPPVTNGHPAVTGGLTACAACHPETMTPEGTLDPAGRHINGVVEAAGCTACHGSSTDPAPPKDTTGNTLTSALGVGAHQQHVRANPIADPIACYECHGNATLSYTSGHSNGTVDINFTGVANTGVTSGWNRTAATCATYCHGGTTLLKGGAATTPVWTRVDGTQAQCTSCHGFPPPAPHPANTACSSCHPTVNADNATINVASGLHINGVIDTTGLTCFSCHGTAGVDAAPPVDTKGNSSTTVVTVGAHQAHNKPGALRGIGMACSNCHGAAAASYTVTHPDGQIQISFTGLPNQGTTTVWTEASATCAASYCHGGSTALKGGSATTPVWTKVDGTQKTCGSCHGDPPPAPHVARTDCASCHGAGYSSTTVAAATHINGTVDVVTLACTSCHGNASLVTVAGADVNAKAAPPVDTAGNTASTARGVGAHLTHLNGSRSKPVACNECHAVPTSMSHNDGTVQVALKTGAYTATSLTCASTYCHGNFSGGAGTAATPAWTSAGPLACTSCHGNPPTANGHPANTACGDCHGAGYSSSTVNAATHVDGAVTLPTAAHASGTCTACHGDATKTVLATADVNAKAAPPVGTKGETATTTRAVGAHAAHLNQTTLRQAPLACNECHTVPAAGDKTHANGTAAVAFGTLSKTGGITTAAWNGTALTCASTYCHGNFKNGNTTNAPSWTGGVAAAGCTSCHGSPPSGTHPANTACASCHTGYTATTVNAATHINGVVDVANMTCTSCHGDAARVAVAGGDTAINVQAAPPVDSKGNAAVTARGVGVHQVHVNGTRSKAQLCSECHIVPTTTSHSDGLVQVAFSKGGTFDGTALSCASTYCHGNFTGGAGTAATPAWTTAGALACTSCHGNPPALPHPQGTACADCHGAGYSQTTVNAATHVDGAVTLPTTAHVAGSCTACHGDNTKTVLAAADANAKAAPPVGTRSETLATTKAVGAHVAHLNQTTLRSAPLACAECHAVPAAGDKTHANGTAAVAFGTLSKTGGITAAAYNTTALTCASTYCHGNFKNGNTTNAPSWTGGVAQAGCTSCHGSPPTGTHPANTACASCHNGYTATTVNAATHINGVVDVINMTCTSCHGDAARVAVAGGDTAINVQAAPPVDSKGNSAVTARGVGVHQVHVNGTRSKAQLCSACHTVPTTTSHSDGVVQVAFSKGGTFDGTALSCASTYCHGNFTGGAGTAATPAWTAAGTLACTSCHGNPPALPHPQDTACADCHGAGYSQTTVNAATHVDGAVTLPTTAHVAGSCTACHGDSTKTVLAAADANAKAAPPIGSKGETVTTAKAVGAHAAHLNQTTFRSAPLACTECHAVPAAGDKTHANGTAAVAFGTLARTGGAAAAYNTTALSCASVYCHGGTTVVQGGTATTPAWTGSFTAGTSTLGCTSCHGAPPTANGHPQRTDCGACHPNATATAYNAATHINGVIDTVNLTCTSCHGGAGVVAVAGADANLAAAPPIDSKGNAGTTAVGVGVHQVHVNGSRSKPVACAACHNGAVPTTVNHENGVVTVAFGGTATTGGVVPTYAVGSGGSCGATYCHGNFSGGAGSIATPAWVAAGTLACTACHGNPPALPHPQDTACADCHGAGYSQTTVNAATHVDGAVTLPTTAHVASSCTACHGDNTKTVLAAADANAKAAPPISSTGQTLTTQRGVGAHVSHLNQTTFRSAPITCAECHAVPAAGDKTHANGTAAVAFGTLSRNGGATPAWNGASLSCSSVYCHGNFTNGNGNGAGGGTASAPAAAPTGLAFGNVAATSLSLSWGTVTGATSYKVERAPNGSTTFAQIGTSAGTSYADAGLAASTTYQYRVRATNDAGDGPYSATASQATTAAGTGTVAAPTAAPTGLAFTNVAASSLTLTWTGAAGAAAYKIERAPSGSTTFAQVGTSSATSFADAGLTASTTYQYRVRATNDGGDGPYSATASQATTAASTGGTGTPVATRYDVAPATATSVGLDGTTNVTAQTSYDYNNPTQTFRAMGVAGYTQSATQGRFRAGTAMSANATYTVVNVYSPALTDSNRAVSANVPVSVDYYVRTAATNSSATIRATLYEYNPSTGNVGAAKGTYTSTSISTATTTTTFATRSGTIPNAAFTVAAGNRLKVVIQVVNGATAGNDVALLFGATRTGTNGQTFITPSLASVTGGTTTPAAPTAAPTTLAFSNVGQTTLTLGWAAVTGATHYMVERAPDVAGAAGTFVQVGTTATTTYGDAGLAASTRYWYRVRAWNAGGFGPYSTNASQTTTAPAAAPTAPTAAPATLAFGTVSPTTLTLSWSAVTGATHYKVERAPDVSGAAGTFAQVGTTATASYGDAGLTAGTKYWYRVRAWNAGGDGPYSANATQTTATVAPVAGGVAWTGNFTAGTSSLNCQSCHGTPPGGTHPVVATGGSCGGCHTGYTATAGSTTGTVNAALHMNGAVDAAGGGEPSAAGSACGGCHSTLINTMNGTTAKASKHTIGTDSPTDGALSWTGANLQASVPAASRSCVTMCHSDHPHTGTGTTHNGNVYADATTQTTRAATKIASDFDAAQTNGGLCISCHQKPVDANNPVQRPALTKADYQGKAHDFVSNAVGTTTNAWQYTLHDNSQFQRNCTKCHASQTEGLTPTVAANNSGTVGPHASDFGQLLAGNTNPGTTPASFVCFNCHGDNTTGKNLSGKVLVTETVKAQGHGGKFTSTTHNTVTEDNATYNSGAYSGTNRHVNCIDCHDQHRAGKTKHTVGPNDGAITATSPLYGVSGVGYTGTLPANFAAIPAANLAKVAVATAEYQVCFKCHTGWAFGTTPPTGPSTFVETDLAQEFNVNNKSAHPVVNTLAAQTGSTAKGLVASQLLAPWNTSPGSQTMTCSDCHNSDAASPAAQGPHGSAIRFMLAGVNKGWPYTVAGATTGTVFRVATSETGIGTVNGLFCRNCHPQMNSAGSNSLHRNSNIAGGQHGGSSAVAACTGCHIRIPHGGKVSRLLVTTPAPARYKLGTSNFAQITKGANKDSYNASGFPTGFKSSCSEHSSGTGNETW